MGHMTPRVLDARPGELPAALGSFAYFFCLLAGYYILRPLREELGIQGGAANLPWLFTAIFVAMLAMVPAYGWLSARLTRARLMRCVYLFFIANLLGFHAALEAGVEPAWVARAFFVWVSVFNLFVVSVFWSFMVDIWTEEQGERLFGFIAAGGTAGALAGPSITALFAAPLGPVNLLLVSCAFLGAALACIEGLARWARGRGAAPGLPPPGEGALGGSIWSGLARVASSPYLAGICFYLVSYSLLSTLLYFEIVRMVAAEYASPAERTRLFATLDLTVNLATLAVQVLVTSSLFRRLGVTFALALMPAFAIAGFALIGALPTLGVMITVGVVRRAGEFAISKPARELLFTVLSREDKYKAKSVVDTVVYRGGDMLSGWINSALRGLGLGPAGIAAAALPLAAAWLWVACRLGREQRARLEAGRGTR